MNEDFQQFKFGQCLAVEQNTRPYRAGAARGGISA